MAKNLSNIFSSQEVGEIQQWMPPDVEAPGKEPTAQEQARSLPTADQLEQLQKQAYEEGYAQGQREGFEYGHKEALAKGRSQIEGNIARFERLMKTLEKPLQQLDEQVEQEMVELVIAMVRQLVRREIKTDPGHIIGVVREALAILPLSSRNIHLMLHPEDAQLVREVYALNENEPGWHIVEDPVLARGGCRVVTDTSQVDATLESRLTTLIAPLLAGERGQDLVRKEA